MAHFYARAWNDSSLASNLGVSIILTPTNPTSPGETILAASQYGATDSRISEGIIDYDSYLTKKFDNTHGNIHVIRLAEMFLTRAEGNLRAGTSVGAAPLADINRIRARAGATPLTSVTPTSVLSERHRELAFEGFLLHDQKRDKAAVGTLPYNSPRLIFPIPQRERDVNGNLVQNEGY